MLYKKLTKINMKIFDPKNITKLLQCAMLFRKINDKKNEINYFDDIWLFILKKNQFCGWRPKNSKSFLAGLMTRCVSVFLLDFQRIDIMELWDQKSQSNPIYFWSASSDWWKIFKSDTN